MSEKRVHPIGRPGETLKFADIRDLIECDESSSVTVEWRRTMQDIGNRTVRPGNV